MQLIYTETETETKTNWKVMNFFKSPQVHFVL